MDTPSEHLDELSNEAVIDQAIHHYVEGDLEGLVTDWVCVLEYIDRESGKRMTVGLSSQDLSVWHIDGLLHYGLHEMEWGEEEDE